MENPSLTSKSNLAPTLLIASCLTLFSFCLNLSLLYPGPYHSDTIGFANAIKLSLSTGHIHLLHGHGHPFTAILGIAFYLFLNLFGIYDPIVSVNILSALSSSLCVGLTFLIGRRLFNMWTGVFSAVLLAMNPIFLGTSLYGNSHMPALCLFLISLLLLLNEKLSLTHLIVSGLILGLSLASRIQDTALTSFAYIFLLFTLPKTSLRKNSFLYRLVPLFIATVSIIIVYAMTAKNSLVSKAVWQLQPEQTFILNWGANIKFAIQTLRPAFSLFGFIMIFVGTVWGCLKNKRDIFFLYIWALPALLFASALNFTTPRLFIPCLIPLIYLIALPFSHALNIKRAPVRILVLALYLCLTFIPFIHILPVLQQRHDRAWTKEWVLWAKSKTPDNAKIIATDLKNFLNYYGAQSLDRPLNGSIAEDSLETFAESLKKNIAAGIPVYITEVGLFSYDNNRQFSQFLKKNFSLKKIGAYPLERWHRGCLNLDIIFVDLIRIDKK